MANKKISQLSVRTPSLTDLMLIGDPSTGFSYKATISAVSSVIESAIGGNYVTLATTQTISGAKTFSNTLTLSSVSNASTDTDKFVVLDGGVIKYRTGTQVLSDIGGVGGSGTSGYVPKFTGASSLANSNIYESPTTGNIIINSNVDNDFTFDVNGDARIQSGLTLLSTISNGTYTYTLPSATGTLALTSNIPSVSGTTNYVPKFTSSSAIGNSLIYDNGTNVGIGTSSPTTNTQIVGANGVTDSYGQLFVSTNNTATQDYGGQLTLGGYYNGTSNQTAFGAISGRKENGTSGSALGYLSFATQSGSITEKMRITSGGNVLVGGTSSTNSTAKLQIFGSTTASTNNGQLRINDNTTTTKTLSIGVDGTNSLSFIHSINDGVAYMPLVLNGLGGNILVGTLTDAGYKLDINGTGRFNGVVYLSGGANVSDGSSILFGGSNALISGSASSEEMLISAGSTSAGHILFYTGNSEKMRLNATGLGIGTTSPAEKLSVAGNGYFLNSGVTELSIRTPNSTFNDSYLSFGTDVYNRAQIRVSGANASSGFMAFTTFDAGSGTEKMRITSGGNVGIGTSSPNFTAANRTTVDINGTSSSGLSLSAGGTSYGFLYVNSGAYVIGTGASSATIPISFETSGSERMKIKSNGIINLSNVPSSSAGLSSGDIYKTVAGILMIV